MEELSENAPENAKTKDSAHDLIEIKDDIKEETSKVDGDRNNELMSDTNFLEEKLFASLESKLEERDQRQRTEMEELVNQCAKQIKAEFQEEIKVVKEELLEEITAIAAKRSNETSVIHHDITEVNEDQAQMAKQPLDEHNEKLRMRKTFLSFTQITTMHGIIHIFSMNSKKSRKLLWAAILMVGFVAYFCFAASAISRYLTYPVVSTTEVHFVQEIELPAITLCPLQPLKKSF